MTGIIKNNEGRSSGLKKATTGVDGVNWQTDSIKTSTFTATSGEGYFCNTSGGAFTVNLPSASVGNIISIKDYSGTFQTNNLTITPNGSEKIDGAAGDATVSTENAAITLIYADSTRGWLNVEDSTNVEGETFMTASGGTVTTVCTNFKVHTFTSPGTFTVCSVASSPANNAVAYMVVAGGGGNGNAGGAGGGGGFREGTTSPIVPYTASPLVAPAGLTVSATGYPITVGAGGSGTGSPPVNGVNGSNSIFSTITSAGGGYGGGRNVNGGAGGSGGGSGDYTPSGAGGAGNTPPVSPPQGNRGGNGSPGENGGGGGGAGGNGGDGNGSPGAGVVSQITASPVTYSPGGAGDGASPAPGPATPRANTGGGSSNADVGAGSGIVVIRYKFQ